MKKNELWINGEDAFDLWGVSLSETSLSELMVPSSNKAYIENESRLQHGKQIIVADSKMDARSITLQVNLIADNESQFFDRYDRFCKVLANGTLNIRTCYRPDVVYKTVYVSCSQFSQFMRGIAKFSLKLIEPNPNDRTI